MINCSSRINTHFHPFALQNDLLNPKSDRQPGPSVSPEVHTYSNYYTRNHFKERPPIQRSRHPPTPQRPTIPASPSAVSTSSPPAHSPSHTSVAFTAPRAGIAASSSFFETDSLLHPPPISRNGNGWGSSRCWTLYGTSAVRQGSGSVRSVWAVNVAVGRGGAV